MENMDDDVELIVPDSLDDPHLNGMFPDFSQIQIQVHRPEVAERILDNFDDHSLSNEVFGTEEYLDDDEDDVQEISDDCQEPETITDDCKENIFIQEQTETHTDTHEYTNIPNDDMEQGEYFFDGTEKIPDKEINNYDALIEEYPSYENVVIKQEESFTVDDYTEFDESVEQNDLQNEYVRSNVIILGSKPCQSTSNNVLKRLLFEQDSMDCDTVQKEYLETTVCLEDWGAKLERSQCFCKKCGTLFVTSNDLDAHNMMAHSFLVPVNKNVAIKSTAKPAYARKSTGSSFVNNKNIARKSTGKVGDSKFCNHCNLIFPDHNTLIKHLYELLPLKQFTCNICDSVFKTANDLMEHNEIHVKHEKIKDKKNKIEYKGADVKKLKSTTKEKPNLEMQFQAIPKSILFQCPKCSIYFISAMVQYMHMLNCVQSMKRIITCEICKRKMYLKDADIHRKQHEICTKFRVLKTSINLSERAMCKCPTCELHFSDIGISLHIKDCGKIPSLHCNKCNLLLPKSRFAQHMKLHTKQNLKPKDFLHIQYSIQQVGLKRKLVTPVLPAKKIKLENNINVNMTVTSAKGRLPKVSHKYRMFFCKFCKGCCMWQTKKVLHTNGKCVKSKMPIKICSECGLKFNSLKYHKTLHRKDYVFNIRDVAFFDLHSMKRIIPTIPDYPQCKSCKIKFFDQKLLPTHICGEDYETCVICQENYHSTAYEVHKEFHNLNKANQTISKPVIKLLPELMKKYESLNMMWNLLYCCKRCDIVTDQYDKAVEHSQGHLNQQIVTTNIKCYLCNLKFDDTCWSKHSYLHSKMEINSRDFNILHYNPQKLLTEEWFEMFESIPEDQIRQVTDQSVYSHDRSFKMTLLKEGRSEFTIHCCSDCKVCYRSEEIEKHVNSICKKSTNICKICSVPFSDISSLKMHQNLHAKGIKKEEFRVVLFMKEGRSKAKIKTKPSLKINKLQQQKARMALAKRNKIKINKKVTNSTYTDKTGKYILYKCKKCKCCVGKKNLRSHMCYSQNNRTKCIYCNEFFISRNVKKHENRHLNLPDFTPKNTIIKLFEPSHKVNQVKKIAKISKPAKYVSKKVTKVKSSITKANCDSEMESKDFNVSTTSKTDTVYKCKCGLHYTSLKNIEKHAQSCDSNAEISKENCSKCGLLFPTDVLVSHLCKHHSKNSKFVVEQYQKDANNVESTSESNVSNNKTETKTIIYKCSECNVYFVNQNTCYRHVYKDHKPFIENSFIECKLCGLAFRLKTLPVHVTRHHSTYFSLDNVLIEEYQPRNPGESMKKEIYLAANKIQSFQVTSSIDE